MLTRCRSLPMPDDIGNCRHTTFYGSRAESEATRPSLPDSIASAGPNLVTGYVPVTHCSMGVRAAGSFFYEMRLLRLEGS